MNTTSFIDLLRRDKIASIAIPIIQRDYAQGRRDEDTNRIRSAFLEALHDALTTDRPVHLDFIYGEIDGDRLVPLDGQQRLTALFLLHWYLTARTGIGGDDANRFPALTYDTRYSSRLFCGKLVEQHPFPLPGGARLSEWLRDRSWFVRAWRHDPTIDSMLVVLDAIDRRFADVDCSAAWTRLVDVDRPAITFAFLPIVNLGLTDDLYIKMNSRGKPLTKFENFKAEFEELVRGVSQERYTELCAKIDNQWSDVLWKLRGYDNLIDDLFLGYFRFVTDTLGHWTNRVVRGSDLENAVAIYGHENPEHVSNLGFLFAAFDVWHGIDARSWFKDVFTVTDHQAGKVALFDSVDLLSDCCRHYGDGRQFPLWRLLLLFAVVQHLRTDSADFPTRLRALRNLLLNSQNEVRQYALPSLLKETAQLVATGTYSDIRAFNRRQVREEAEKVALIAAEPTLMQPLNRLEDHPLLRGCLAAFDLSALHFERRAAAFSEIFCRGGGLPIPETKAALLACGDYSQRNRNGRFQFGADSRELVWRELLTKDGSDDFSKTQAALGALIDAVGTAADGSIRDRLLGVTGRYLAEQEANSTFDWRYYLVKYSEMRTGDSGIYAGSNDEMGFSLCMMWRTQMNSWYRDPYLYAICVQSGADLEKDVADPWFTGYAHVERWLHLHQSGVEIRCVEDGFLVKTPTVASYSAAFERLESKYGVTADRLALIPQVTKDGVLYDTVDRVLLGAQLLTDLLTMPQG